MNRSQARRVAIACLVACGTAVHAQQTAPAVLAQQPGPPLPTVEFTVEVLGSKMAEFDAKMEEYAKLRRSLEKGLPALAVTDNPSEIRRAEQLLAQRIRRARAGAGDR